MCIPYGFHDHDIQHDQGHKAGDLLNRSKTPVAVIAEKIPLTEGLIEELSKALTMEIKDDRMKSRHLVLPVCNVHLRTPRIYRRVLKRRRSVVRKNHGSRFLSSVCIDMAIEKPQCRTAYVSTLKETSNRL